MMEVENFSSPEENCQKVINQLDTVARFIETVSRAIKLLQNNTDKLGNLFKSLGGHFRKLGLQEPGDIKQSANLAILILKSIAETAGYVFNGLGDGCIFISQNCLAPIDQAVETYVKPIAEILTTIIVIYNAVKGFVNLCSG